MARPIGDPVPRFWKFVDKSAGDDKCWPWRGGNNGRGYGVFGMGGAKGRMHYAHRVSWMFANGPIPDGFHVCHHCDNPPCVNPSHLFVGTVSDNAQDKCRKDRHWMQRNGAKFSGDSNPNARLTQAQVDEIRVLYDARLATQITLARRFNVGRTTVSHIVRRETWI